MSLGTKPVGLFLSPSIILKSSLIRSLSFSFFDTSFILYILHFLLFNLLRKCIFFHFILGECYFYSPSLSSILSSVNFFHFPSSLIFLFIFLFFNQFTLLNLFRYLLYRYSFSFQTDVGVTRFFLNFFFTRFRFVLFFLRDFLHFFFIHLFIHFSFYTIDQSLPVSFFISLSLSLSLTFYIHLSSAHRLFLFLNPTNTHSPLMPHFSSPRASV
ncbi:unnamed protein product [Acanthosepion pharaonis]|uniref:Uncharacterized protein n=1 Tax=Acanthosepion pharaonis TaxID=158019 RepID=A0A812BCI1_ACAPH|nr:unnamed protein product [Sepia pharaonis]